MRFGSPPPTVGASYLGRAIVFWEYCEERAPVWEAMEFVEDGGGVMDARMCVGATEGRHRGFFFAMWIHET